MPTAKTEETKPTHIETGRYGIIIALIGIIEVFSIGIPILGIILAVLAILIGAIGNQSNKKEAKASIILGLVLLILSVATRVETYYIPSISYFT